MKRILFHVTILFFLSSISIFSLYQNIRVSSTTSSDPEEVTIAINTKNPSELAAGANISYSYRSTDGGNTWVQDILNSSFGVWGDPCVIYDGLGYLYYAHLSPNSLDRIVVHKSTDDGETWNQGSGIGYNSPKNQDKEWLAVDLQDTPYKNYIYTTWTEFDRYGSSSSFDSTRILFSRSTDNGISWSTPA